jgi:hypothetical protein
MGLLDHKTRRRESLAGRVAIAAATLGGALVLFRAVPDLIRYLRVRRM